MKSAVLYSNFCLYIRTTVQEGRGTAETRAQHTRPRPQPRLAGVNKTHTQPQPGPNHKRKPTVGNPVPTARALRQPEPCR